MSTSTSPRQPAGPTAVTWPAMPTSAASTVTTMTAGAGDRVLRGARAGLAATARFDVDLRRGIARRGVPAGTAGTVAGGAAGTAGTVAGGAAGAWGTVRGGGAGAVDGAQLGEPDGVRDDPEARAVGYAAGWAEGRRAAQQAAVEEAERAAADAERATAEHASRVGQAVAALAAAANRLDSRATPSIESIEQAIVSAAFTIAEAVICRELAIASDPGADALARALQAVPQDRPVTVRLHPNDLATLAEHGTEQPTCIVDGREVRLVADRGLRPGDATAECDATTFEVRIADSVEKIRAILLGEGEV